MKRYQVTVEAPGIGLVNLPVPRTEAEVSDLRTRYKILDLRQVETALPNDWSVAMGALSRLAQRSEPELAARAERALSELLGKQKFLEASDEEEEDPVPPRRDTLTGIGVAR